jgi:hypothetical protein
VPFPGGAPRVGKRPDLAASRPAHDTFTDHRCLCP